MSLIKKKWIHAYFLPFFCILIAIREEIVRKSCRKLWGWNPSSSEGLKDVYVCPRHLIIQASWFVNLWKDHQLNGPTTNTPMDWSTNRPTDKASFSVARPRLKTLLHFTKKCQWHWFSLSKAWVFDRYHPRAKVQNSEVASRRRCARFLLCLA